LLGETNEDQAASAWAGLRRNSRAPRQNQRDESGRRRTAASRQWYLKFDEVIKKFGFVKNQVDNCVYIKIKGSMFIILILYVDDILLTSSDKNLLHETNGFLSSNFDMKDLGDASYVLGIEIHRNRIKGESVWPLSKSLYRESVKKV
jgi:hypothetical protein